MCVFVCVNVCVPLLAVCVLRACVCLLDPPRFSAVAQMIAQKWFNPGSTSSRSSTVQQIHAPQKSKISTPSIIQVCRYCWPANNDVALSAIYIYTKSGLFVCLDVLPRCSRFFSAHSTGRQTQLQLDQYHGEVRVSTFA